MNSFVVGLLPQRLELSMVRLCLPHRWKAEISAIRALSVPLIWAEQSFPDHSPSRKEAEPPLVCPKLFRRGIRGIA